MTTNTLPRIAIIGAGPGGLTLARMLQMRNIPTIVFEKESHPNERSQGGTLDLHPKSGLLAVHMAKLGAQFGAIARYEDQGVRFLNKAGQMLYENEQGNEIGDRPEVDRAELRAMLLDSLAPSVVRWGHALRYVRQAHDGSTHELVFENGVTESFDLVVGADGAWSHVRPLLSNATPVYAGVTFIEFGLDDVDQQHPALAQLVGHGGMYALADNKGLIALRNAHAHIRIYACIRIPEKWETRSGFDAGNPQTARAWLLNYFSDWDQSLLALIQDADDHFVVRSLYMLPIGHRWNFHAGVTLLGDAAHLTTPSGDGVNLAMLDAVDLASAINECSTLEEAVRRYEKTMFPRAEIASREAIEGGMNLLIAPDGPTSVLASASEMEAHEHA